MRWEAPWLLAAPQPIGDYDQHSEFFELEHVNATDDLRFWETIVDQLPDPVIELGCGAGRITEVLASRGHRIVGLDASAGMLNRASRRLSALPQASAIRCDIRNIPLRDKSVPAVIAPTGTFSYLTSFQDQIAASTELFRIIRDGGTAIVDLAMLPLGTRFTVGHAPLRFDGEYRDDAAVATTFSQSTLDVDWNVCRYTEISDVTRGGVTNRFVVRHDWHIYTVFEVCYLFMLAGFTIEDAHGDYNGSPYCGSSRRLILYMKRGCDRP